MIEGGCGVEELEGVYTKMWGGEGRSREGVEWRRVWAED